MWLPGAVWRGVLALPSVLRGTPGFLRGVLQSASGAVAEDFAGVLARYPRLAGVAQGLGFAGKAGMYLGVNFARVAGALLTPLRFDDIAALGFRGAWAAVRDAASWSKGVEEFRAGWVGYGRLGVVVKGVVGAGLHEVGLVGWRAGSAGLHEPEVAPVVAGMQWHRMLDGLEKLPEGEFKQLFVGAGGILQPVMGMPSALVRDVGAPGLREEEFASLVAVAYVLHTQGETAAQVLAGALAKELGGAPLHGLAGGAPVRETLLGESSGQVSEPVLWVPESVWTRHTSDVRNMEEQGVLSGSGQRSPLIPVLPDELPLLQQKLEQDAFAEGLISTHHGLTVSAKLVFTPEVLQTLERIGKGGMKPGLLEQLRVESVLGRDDMAMPAGVLHEFHGMAHSSPFSGSDVQQTLSLLTPEGMAVGGLEKSEYKLGLGHAEVMPGGEHGDLSILEHRLRRSFGDLAEPVTLQGAPQLAGAQVRLLQVDGELLRVVLQDAQGTPLAGREATLRIGGGYTISGGPEGDLYFSKGLKFQFRLLPLPGSDWAVRFKESLGMAGGRLAYPEHGAVVLDAPGVELVRDTRGGISVRMQAPDGFGGVAKSTWRLDAGGLREMELPLSGERIGGLGGLSIRVGYRPDGSISGRSLVGGLGRGKLFEEVAVPQELVDRLGKNSFSFRELATGEVVHFDEEGHTVEFGHDGEPTVGAGEALTHFEPSPQLGGPITHQPFREMALSAPGLDEMRLQVVDKAVPGGRWESTPLQLVDGFGKTAGGHEVLSHADGNVTITTATGDRQWNFGSDLRLESLDVRLPGQQEFVRLDHVGGGLPQVVGRDGTVVDGFAVRSLPKLSVGGVPGAEVRLTGAGAAGVPVWRLDGTGVLRELGMPLRGVEDNAQLRSLLVVAPADAAGAAGRELLTLDGAPTALERFSLGRTPEGLAEDPRVTFTLSDQRTGARFHYDSLAQLVLRDVPLDLGSRELRGLVDFGTFRGSYLRIDATGRTAEVVDAQGRPLQALQTQTLDGGRIVLTRTDLAEPAQGRIVLDAYNGRVVEETAGDGRAPVVSLQRATGAGWEFQRTGAHIAPQARELLHEGSEFTSVGGLGHMLDGHDGNVLDVVNTERLIPHAEEGAHPASLDPSVLHAQERTLPAHHELLAEAHQAMQVFTVAPVHEGATEMDRVVGEFTVAPVDGGSHAEPVGDRLVEAEEDPEVAAALREHQMRQESALRGLEFADGEQFERYQAARAGRSGTPQEKLSGIPLKSFEESPVQKIAFSAPGMKGLWLRIADDSAGVVDNSGKAVAGYRALQRADGGVDVTTAGGDVRWRFGPEPKRRLEVHEVRLQGGQEFVRFNRADGGAPRVVDRNGTPVADGFTVRRVRNATGQVSEVTVRRTEAGTGATVVWHLTAAGVLREMELPLSGEGIHALSGVRVRVGYRPDGSVARRSMRGPSGVTEQFREVQVPQELAGRLGKGGFALREQATGRVVYFDGTGRAVDIAHDLSAAKSGPRVELTDLNAPGKDEFLRLPSGRIIQDVPLAGSELKGLRLRLRSAEDGARPQPELIDLTHPAGRTEWTVTTRDGGGYTVADPAGDHRWRLTANLEEESKDVRLTGTERFVRFGADSKISVVDESGRTVEGEYILKAASDMTTGQVTRLQVRLGEDTPAVQDAPLVWEFDDERELRAIEVELTDEGLPEALRGMRVVIDHATGKPLALRGPLADSGPLAPQLLQLEADHGFAIADPVTGTQYSFTSRGRLASHLDDASEHSPTLPEAGPSERRVLIDLRGKQAGETLSPTQHLLDLWQQTLGEAQALGHGLQKAPTGGRMADRLLRDPIAERIADALAPMDHASQLSESARWPNAARTEDLSAAAQTAFREQGLDPRLAVESVRALRQEAGAALRDDAYRAVEGTLPEARSRFIVTEAEGGHRVEQLSTGLVVRFGAHEDVREFFPGDAPSEMFRLKVAAVDFHGGHRDIGAIAEVRGEGWEENPIRSYRLTGPAPLLDRFKIINPDHTLAAEHRAFAIHDTVHGTTRYYAHDGTPTYLDLPLPRDLGTLRANLHTPGADPEILPVLAPAGRPAWVRSAKDLGDGRLALIPAHTAGPLERLVVDGYTGKLLEETFVVRRGQGKLTGDYWRIDHTEKKAVRLDAFGAARTGRYDTATVEISSTGDVKLVGAVGLRADVHPGRTPARVVLFEREHFTDGRTMGVHVDDNGRSHWSEFDASGRNLRNGERIWSADRRSFHDVLPHSWLPVNVLDVRTYHEAADGGLIRAEKGMAGGWTWQRFDKEGKLVLSGDRSWDFNHLGFRDYLRERDPVTGRRTLVQRRRNLWPIDLHYAKVRQYFEHGLTTDEVTGEVKVDPQRYTAFAAHGPEVGSLEPLSSGGTLKVTRISEQRLPAMFWKGRAGGSWRDGLGRDFFRGESLYVAHRWTETTANGSKLRGIRLSAFGGSWRDIDQYGRLIRENRVMEDGRTIEVGRDPADPEKWASAPALHEGKPYQLHWRVKPNAPKKGERPVVGQRASGIRYVEADGRWQDVFNSGGIERISMRSQGRGVREYLAEHPDRMRNWAEADNQGVWVDKNHMMQIVGRRDRWGDRYVEASGNPERRTWNWTSYHDDGTVEHGVRKVNRGSRWESVWDDSFRDFEADGRTPVRERHATDKGTNWVNAIKQPDGTWKWERISADGTVHSDGIRTYTDFGKGHWSDTIDGTEVRFRRGDQVREFDYKVGDPVAADHESDSESVYLSPRASFGHDSDSESVYLSPRASFGHDSDSESAYLSPRASFGLEDRGGANGHVPGSHVPGSHVPGSHVPDGHVPMPREKPRHRVTITDLLDWSIHHFEPDSPPHAWRRPLLSVDRQVWKEYNQGKLYQERIATGVKGRYREVNHYQALWREYQDDRLVAQRTFSGRVWETTPFGRWHIAKVAEHPYLPRPGYGQIGKDGDRGWSLVGREAEFRGYMTELRGYYMEMQDPYHRYWTGVKNGESTPIQAWRQEMGKLAMSFATGFTISIAAQLIIAAAFNHGNLTPAGVEKAFFYSGVGGLLGQAENALLDRTRLGAFVQAAGTMDWALYRNHQVTVATEDWANQWARNQETNFWRGAGAWYAFGQGQGVINAFVTNAIVSAIFPVAPPPGVHGAPMTLSGPLALEAGILGSTGALFAGMGTGLGRMIWHNFAQSRVFMRGGGGEIAWNLSEMTLQFFLNTEIGKHLTLGPTLAYPHNTDTSVPGTPGGTAPGGSSGTGQGQQGQAAGAQAGTLSNSPSFKRTQIPLAGSTTESQ
ncbi:MAG: hypothetical protein JO362_20955 [Streptomycetaceae bacterium]|nr:hypothetical protein [Streptomycetaceae bacterium]